MTAVYRDAIKTQPVVKFYYDEKGNRIRKATYSSVSPYNSVEYTWYVRGAGGNVLAIYKTVVVTNVTTQEEIHVHGMNRL